MERLRLPPPEPKPPRKQVRRPKNPLGRGRPVGSKSKNGLSVEQRRAAAMTGELPHQFMLRVMRLAPGDKIGNHVLTWEDVWAAAKSAAPYFAARLASVHIKADDRPPVVIQIDPNKLKDMTPNELSRMLAALMSASAPPTTINGEVVGHGEQDIIDTVDADLYEQTLQ